MCGKRNFRKMVAKTPFGSAAANLPCNAAVITLPTMPGVRFTAPTMTFSKAAIASRITRIKNGLMRFNTRLPYL
ncbi:hypothetical protein SDC9_180678 [bioreactor metagenome]|uniref:Uncharacterized protein n=1 Tax=bioreactor metagenome TaxID=1076179 RepID=A0A645HAQ8_9ZZZZ